MARITHPLPVRRVVQAYQAMFGGRGGAEDAALVLSDLEAFTGFWEVTTADTPNEQTKFAEGQRSVFGRIQALTRVSDAALDQIETAAELAKEI